MSGGMWQPRLIPGLIPHFMSLTHRSLVYSSYFLDQYDAIGWASKEWNSNSDGLAAQDLLGMKNLVTTMILPLDSIMMEILVFTMTVTLEFCIHTVNKLNNMFLVMTRAILRQLGSGQ
ncbi:hypothetical protein U9M48_025588 [Paspalum notatum var. saurae]|uniref:Uncharacterized protein n=1 Tax=Paspalum notatum var. saurae TaxID=547442 RepID=A0AAQ3TQQ1_PASNO